MFNILFAHLNWMSMRRLFF